MRFRWLFCSAVSLAGLTACSPGTSGTATPPPAASSSSDATRTYQLSGGAASVQLPLVGGFGGGIAFPASVARTPASITLTSSLHSPEATGALDAERRIDQSLRAQSTGQLDVYLYVTIVALTTIEFPTIPAISVTLPATIDTAGRQFYYAIQRPPSVGADFTFRTEGPGVVAGQTINFAAATGPLRLEAGQHYIFAFYSVSSPQATPTPLAGTNNMYVANSRGSALTNSVTVYADGASGDAAPIRAIAGSKTGLVNPVGIAVDESGELFVLNALTSTTSPISVGVINVYAPGATGNAAPIRTIAGKNTQLLVTVPGIALDGRGNVAVLNYRPNAIRDPSVIAIDVYDARATSNVAPLRSISYNGGNDSYFGLASDGNGDLASIVASASGLSIGGDIAVYGPGASGEPAPIRAITGNNFLRDPIDLAFSRTGAIAVDEYGDGDAKVLVYASGTNGDHPPTSQIADLPHADYLYLGKMAFDKRGDLAVTVFRSSFGPPLPKNNIYVYNVNSTALLSPLRIVSGVTTALANPSGIAFGP